MHHLFSTLEQPRIHRQQRISRDQVEWQRKWKWKCWQNKEKEGEKKESETSLALLVFHVHIPCDMREKKPSYILAQVKLPFGLVSLSPLLTFGRTTNLLHFDCANSAILTTFTSRPQRKRHASLAYSRLVCDCYVLRVSLSFRVSLCSWCIIIYWRKSSLLWSLSWLICIHMNPNDDTDQPEGWVLHSPERQIKSTGKESERENALLKQTSRYTVEVGISFIWLNSSIKQIYRCYPALFSSLRCL